jgi:hypothetical protein
LLVTDRLAIRIYVITSGRTITLHTEDGNLCEVLTTFSTGLNALNGLTAQVQYFATGTSGTDFAITSATDTHTFNLPTASATNRGALSSADWSTFSGKVGGSGARGQVAFFNGTNSVAGLDNLFWDIANSRLGIGTASPTCRLHITNSSDINPSVINTTSQLQITDNTQSQIRLVSASNIGAAGAYSNIVGLRARGTIGTPTSPLAGDFISAWVSNAYDGTASGGGTAGMFFVAESNISGGSAPQTIAFATSTTNNLNRTDKLQIRSNGNVLLQNGGTFTDGGQRLQVQGTTLFNGATTISGSTTASSAIARGVNVTSTLVAAANNDVLVGLDVNPTFTNGAFTGLTNLALRVTGNSTFTGSLVGSSFLINNADIQNNGFLINVTGSTNRTINFNGTAAFSFRYTGTITIPDTRNFSAFQVDNQTTSISGSGFLSSFRGQISNGSGRWNIYMDGTADNYLAGKLLIGTTTVSTFALDVNGTARVSGAATFSSSVTAIRIITQSGNSVLTSIGNLNYIAKGNDNNYSGFNFQGTSLSDMFFGKAPNSDDLIISTSNTSSPSEIIRFAQNGRIGIGTSSPSASAILQADSTTRGFLPPRMTNAQRTAISSPAVGLIVYCTDMVEGLYVYKSTGWTFVI